MNCYNIENFIFDLDGTLVNSLQEVFRCFRRAFELANYPLNENNLTENIIGPPLRDIVLLIAPELKDENIINCIVENFRETYDTSDKDSGILFDGVEVILKELKSNGCKIFMATYKPMAPTMRIVKTEKIEQYFDEIYGIDKFGKHITKTQMLNDIINKYQLEKSKTVMIGDAPTDMIAAKEVGIKGIGALWGYGSDKSELIKNSDIVLKDIKELLKAEATKAV